MSLVWRPSLSETRNNQARGELKCEYVKQYLDQRHTATIARYLYDCDRLRQIRRLPDVIFNISALAAWKGGGKRCSSTEYCYVLFLFPTHQLVTRLKAQSLHKGHHITMHPAGNIVG